VAAAALGAACGPSQTAPRDTGLDGLALDRVDPGLILPGTKVVLTGRSFVDRPLGAARLRLAGTLGAAPLDVSLDVSYESGTRLALVADDRFAQAVGGALAGTFKGDATLTFDSTVDHKSHASAPLPVSLDLAAQVTPAFGPGASVGDGLSFVNQPTAVNGTGFLLGGTEGETRALLTGCFTPQGRSACNPPTTVEIPASTVADFDRTRLVFPYTPEVSGVGPGAFVGKLILKNVAGSGAVTQSDARDVRFDIQRPAIFSASTTAASLGQYVVVDGGGFVGGAPGEDSLIALKGSYAPNGGGAPRPLDLLLVPEFVAGPRVRYVLDETDPLGQQIDLRGDSGTITGTVTPIVERGAERVVGDPVPVKLQILPVKQVVYLNFLPSYVDSLRKFGLRAADPLIRERVLTVARRDYAGTNVEFRVDPVGDFALYSQVDLAGPDPNGLGLLGYDNSPGKDEDNKRLYDRLGGVNASTQADGYPGFGGVFTESFFGFSKHPGGFAAPLPETNSSFDLIFDAFRPDLPNGVELTASELARLSPEALEDGSSCPALGGDRARQISCAIFVLGSLVGTTMTHEIGHSLGLANPHGPGFHDPGDRQKALMNPGGARPFNERAELFGEGPAVFCDTEFIYLRHILPSDVPPPSVVRPDCL
jgi:hypothetical protein